MKTTDEQNDEFRRQVNRELPKPVGGFETDEQEQAWREAHEARFFQLVHQQVAA